MFLHRIGVERRDRPRKELPIGIPSRRSQNLRFEIGIDVDENVHIIARIACRHALRAEHHRRTIFSGSLVQTVVSEKSIGYRNVEIIFRFRLGFRFRFRFGLRFGFGLRPRRLGAGIAIVTEIVVGLAAGKCQCARGEENQQFFHILLSPNFRLTINGHSLRRP